MNLLSLFKRKPNHRVAMIVKMLEDNREHIEIDGDTGKVRLRIENPATRERILEAARQFYKAKP